MTGPELRAALYALGMGQREFAYAVRVAPETVSRWCNGRKPIPHWIDWKLELMRREREQHGSA